MDANDIKKVGEAMASIKPSLRNEPVRMLGEGNYNVVYEVGGYAVKKPKDGKAEDGDLLCYGLQNTKGLPTDGIVKIEGFGKDSVGQHYVVMERCKGGEIGKLYEGVELLTNGGVLDLMGGLNEFHSRGYVHRDIKPDNIFCTAKKKGKAKIGDFGFLTRRKDDLFKPGDGICGTPIYFPPEKFITAYSTDMIRFSEKRADCWGLGGTFYKVFCGKDIMQLVCECSGVRYNVNDVGKLVWAMKKLYCDANVQKIFKDRLFEDLFKVKAEPTVSYVVAHLLEPNPTLAEGIGKLLAEVKSEEAKEHGAELPALVEIDHEHKPTEKTRPKVEGREEVEEEWKMPALIKVRPKGEGREEEKKKRKGELPALVRAEGRQPSPDAKEEKKKAEDKEHGGHQEYEERLLPPINFGKNSIIEAFRKNTRPGDPANTRIPEAKGSTLGNFKTNKTTKKGGIW
jgi:serine/threonine protein kinase